MLTHSSTHAFLFFFLCVGTRGANADVVEVEEAAHCDPQLFNKVVAALISMLHVPLLAISTPDDEDNYYSQLPEIMHPTSGKPLFKVIRIGMSCDACVAKRIKCVHRKHHIPPWHSGERQQIAAALMSDDLTRQQEAMGRVSSDFVYCFDQAFIAALTRRPAWYFTHPVQVIFVFIDPSGGGKGSEFSMISSSWDGIFHVVSALY